jgi:hypothetical protein
MLAMPPRSRIFVFGGAVLAALVLAACGDVDPPECTTAPSAPTADTTMSFQLSGRPVVLDTAGWSPGFYHDTTRGYAYLTAWSGTMEDYDWLAIQINDFHGAGAYPVHTSWSEAPYAAITYGCSGMNGELWTGEELVPDTVYVTAYDSVSTQIEGTFSARLVGYKYHGVSLLTGGSFRGLLPRY